MSSMLPRFGIRAPVFGSQVALQDPSKFLDASWERNRKLILKAETLGYESVLIAQHIANPHDDELDQLEAWSAAAALAALTSRIEIIAETQPHHLHPATLAKMALQIEDISHGRFAISFVNARNRSELHRIGIDPIGDGDLYAYGHEWMSFVKPLLYGARVSYSSAHFAVHDCKLAPPDRFRPRPRIYLAGDSEPARTLAAETADACLIDGQPLSDVKRLIANLSRHPRSGTPLRYGLSAFVIARSTDDAADDAHGRLKAVATRNPRPHHGGPNQRSNVVTISQLKQSRHYIGSNGGTASGFVGSYDRVAERILEFWDAGIELFILQFHPFEVEMERFAHEVIPRVGELASKSRKVSASMSATLFGTKTN